MTGSLSLRRRILPALLPLAVTPLLHAVPPTPSARVLALVPAACADGPHEGWAPPWARVSATEPVTVRGRTLGTRQRLAIPEAAEAAVEWIAPGGTLRRLAVTYHSPAADGVRPHLNAIAGADCRIVAARRLVYEGTGPAVALEHLDGALAPTGEVEPLNPPVPKGNDPGGVPVAMVDAGVNYLLPSVATRLARDGNGRILGHDFWDRDARPFDANPARSPFFPQRHGTRTASLLLREAPVASLVPYRYPRPDLGRMERLVAEADAAGIVVVNLSLGSNDAQEWRAFERSAAARPHMLFIASAGNNGRDIDRTPVYPAALGLENLLSVTSSDRFGRLAPGSNWGAATVDLMVPAEEQIVTGFDGHARFASGSSYGAVRVSALAACLLAANPDWRAPRLKAAILAMAGPPEAAYTDVVRHGLLPDPAPVRRGACAPEPGTPERVAEHLPPPDVSGAASGDLALRPALVTFRGTGWTADGIHAAAAEAAGILGQCGIRLVAGSVVELDGPVRHRYFREETARETVKAVPVNRPAVFFLTDTLQRQGFDAEAIGRGNSSTRPMLRDTVWITRPVPHPGISLAHELMHLLLDSGDHREAHGALMASRTAPDNVRLSASECARARETGAALGLLAPVDTGAGGAPRELSESGLVER